MLKTNTCNSKKKKTFCILFIIDPLTLHIFTYKANKNVAYIIDEYLCHLYNNKLMYAQPCISFNILYDISFFI